MRAIQISGTKKSVRSDPNVTSLTISSSTQAETEQSLIEEVTSERKLLTRNPEVEHIFIDHLRQHVIEPLPILHGTCAEQIAQVGAGSWSILQGDEDVFSQVPLSGSDPPAASITTGFETLK